MQVLSRGRARLSAIWRNSPVFDLSTMRIILPVIINEIESRTKVNPMKRLLLHEANRFAASADILEETRT